MAVNYFWLADFKFLIDLNLELGEKLAVNLLSLNWVIIGISQQMRLKIVKNMAIRFILFLPLNRVIVNIYITEGVRTFIISSNSSNSNIIIREQLIK
jgi:hypothetical protein